MAVSEKPWADFSEADYTPVEFCHAALIDMNEAGADKTKEMCKLPVNEPNGDLNRNGVHSAAAALVGARGGVQAPAAMKRMAARKLVAIYRSLHEDPPESIRRLAG